MRAAPAGVDPNGLSADPSLSADGRYVAFASQASNLGPIAGRRRIFNIYLFDFGAGRATLISKGRDGSPANGPSTIPSVSANGQVVAFVSQATNLVAHTPRHVISDIFVRDGSGPIRLVSVGFGGVQPDASSAQPVVSADGRFVAFTSAADNLVAGDDNAMPDVFVSDLATGRIQRVSISGSGRQATGASSQGSIRGSFNPSISADGHLVSFTSTATNLVPHDRNGLPDVFVRNRVRGATRRVSLASNGRGQNASIGAPFSQISDLSADGHYVVFDSNASNLARGDRNGHTNIFRHSLVSGRTKLVGTNARGRSGDNDSFAPATSADGRVTVFNSFADNLVSPLAPGPNVFAQDLATGKTTTLDVAVDGGPRGAELDAQLLQQAAVSANGHAVAFVSGADNLVAGDHNGADDVFVRTITR
ncbi:MAG: TolB family protein [Solirubrobacteraceae bacterium]